MAITHISTTQTVSWLKDMYSVNLGVINVADSNYVIENSSAEINLEDGLSLAATKKGQTAKIDMGNIAGQETKSVSWIVRGDTPGT